MEHSIDALLNAMQQDESAVITALKELGQSERHLLAAKLQALASLAMTDERFIPVLLSEAPRLRIHIRIPVESMEQRGSSS
ncbi:hypothetical protein QU481_17880 [Crenobacter sp. SG2303]|uniref:Uncharacterized protein n=1 Tax=Crenobacter oryzisoli TaxID=3056844 RepID=A0ABT7XSG1_9NEIS|nr:MULTISPECIES: hypothetical protein [unclassified Crenobacter]MDN0076729.1 hypothetical protein [Crenobacter sp. SG2303]MDN0085012.1 hypothetical protein [Crenobacter sp. SG2305]